MPCRAEQPYEDEELDLTYEEDLIDYDHGYDSTQYQEADLPEVSLSYVSSPSIPCDRSKAVSITPKKRRSRGAEKEKTADPISLVSIWCSVLREC